MLTDGIDRAIKIRHSAVVDHVRRVRLRYPSATPDELMAALENKYLAAVTSSGAAFGAAAGAPRVKASVAWALSVADTVAFFEATALFTLAVAEVRGTPVYDVQRRRMLMQAICFGTGGPGLARSSRRVRHWLVTRYRAHRWILVISMVLPFGIGAAIGAASNRARGRMVVAASRQLLGAVPQLVPALPDVLPDVAPLSIAAERRPVISAPAPSPAQAPNGRALRMGQYLQMGQCLRMGQSLRMGRWLRSLASTDRCSNTSPPGAMVRSRWASSRSASWCPVGCRSRRGRNGAGGPIRLVASRPRPGSQRTLRSPTSIWRR